MSGLLQALLILALLIRPVLSLPLTLFPTVGGGVFFPPQTVIANYGVFCLANILFHYLTFHT